jgi:hypothetical protein
MTEREAQVQFAAMVGTLIAKALSLGFEVTLGDAYRDPRVPYGHPQSLHKHRLAIDLNLFKGGIYLPQSEAHRPLGEWWERQGGAWGGRFTPPDGNHYSLAWGGMR